MDKKTSLYSCSLLLSLWTALGYLLPVPLYADWATAYGISPRSISMANAYTALSDDPFAGAYNPAGIATYPRSTIVMGYLYNAPRVKLKGPGYKGSPVAFEKSGRAPCGGFSLHLGWMFEPMNKAMKKYMSFLPEIFQPDIDGAMSLTMAFMGGGKIMSDISTVWDEDIKYPVFGQAHNNMVSGSGFGMKLNKWLYFGSAFRFSMVCQIADGNFDGVFSNDLQTMEIDYHRLGVNVETGVLPVIGLIILPVEDTRIGAVWKKGGGGSNFHGSYNLFMRTENGAINFKFPEMKNTPMWEFWFPEEISVSVACQITEKLLIALEGSYIDYCDYWLPYGEEPRQNVFQWVLVSRIGMEYEASENLKIRAGYYHYPPVVKNIQMYTQLMDTHKHVFSAGLGYRWQYPSRLMGHPLQIDFGCYFQYLQKKTIQVLTANEPSGLPAEPGPLTIIGHIAGAALTITMKFDD